MPNLKVLDHSCEVAVIGAGTMGAGIAQVAAAAGHPVMLFDAAAGAAERGKQRLISGLNALVEKGKLKARDVESLVSRIQIADAIEDLSNARLVIEAIGEDLDIKRSLFSQLECIVADEAILATNTSSISITAIASGLKEPGRVVGMHFFNPAPVMKLVEIVSAVTTEQSVAAVVHDTAVSWGKIAVHTKSTPGFIVNRVARGYYGEALRLLEEGVADAATIDAIMTEGGGFRMGPFALMDLIGHDVNYAVSKSVFDAYHQEPRFRPSIIQQELVDAKRLGRKSGRGFYEYGHTAILPQPRTEKLDPDISAWDPVQLSGIREVRDNVTIMPSDGRTARTCYNADRLPTIVYDLCEDRGGQRRLAFSRSPGVSDDNASSFIVTLAEQGISSTELPDWPGLIALRILAVIVNEAFEAVLQGVATEHAIDQAMRFGVNYPEGPISWARRLGLTRVLHVLDTLLDQTGDPRYRASYALRRAVSE